MPTVIEKPDIGFVCRDGKWIFDSGSVVGQADTLAEAFRKCEAALRAVEEDGLRQSKS